MDITAETWHLASRVGRKRGKLHLPVKLLNGGHRAACNRSIILRDERYPASRVPKMFEDGRVCTVCLKKLGVR
jgi:hypothetical protein